MERKAHWLKQFEHFQSALKILTTTVADAKQRKLTVIEMLGVLLAFRQNYELAWTCLKEIFEDQGEIYMDDDRTVIRLAFRRGLLDDGETWMDMLKNVDNTDHAYNPEIAFKLSKKILGTYYPLFLELKKTLEQEKSAGGK